MLWELHTGEHGPQWPRGSGICLVCRTWAEGVSEGLTDRVALGLGLGDGQDFPGWRVIVGVRNAQTHGDLVVLVSLSTSCVVGGWGREEGRWAGPDHEVPPRRGSVCPADGLDLLVSCPTSSYTPPSE